MHIAIIGAGNIGGALARRLTALDHDVYVANSRHPDTLHDLAQQTGATAVWASDAPRGADLVVVSIPFKNVPDLPAGFLSQRGPDAPIIDTANYYPRERDGYVAEVEQGMPESVWVAQQLGEPVFKVFNNIGADFLLNGALPAGDPDRIALPVAGNAGASLEVVRGTVDALGFDAVYAGPLEQSWRQQPSSPVYGRNYDAAGVERALAEATPRRLDDFRALQDARPPA